MNWFIYFTITIIFAVPVKGFATEEQCDKERAAQFVELVKDMDRGEQLIEPTFAPHDSDDLKDVQDRLEQILNRGIPKSDVYYKVVEKKTAITCSIGKHSTAVVILQLKETECKKSTVLTDEAQRQSCEPKEDGRTIECAWSGEALTSPFTYGFWCAQTTEETFSYPKREELCTAWRYRGTTAYRLPVPEKYRRWSVQMDAYAPPECTSSSYFGTECTKLSMEDVQKVDQSAPPQELRHRDGRTGIRGRGVNRKLGSNTYSHLLILRKTEQGDKQVLMRRIAVKTGHFSLPMFPSGDLPFAHALGSAVIRQMAPKVMECSKAAIKSVLKASTKLYGGDMWDARNTDNAWMSLYSHVISEESYLENIKHGAESDFTWLSINKTTEDYLKDLLVKTYAPETVQKLMEPTGSIKEKLLVLKDLNIVRQTIDLSNCAALYHPFVPMGLPLSTFFGILALAVFYF
ncbi:hypothetical protein D918_03205 [Trichuris suis]|nr:hypothetical protein D918_03205 [Trichuris suis]